MKPHITSFFIRPYLWAFLHKRIYINRDAPQTFGETKPCLRREICIIPFARQVLISDPLCVSDIILLKRLFYMNGKIRQCCD